MVPPIYQILLWFLGSRNLVLCLSNEQNDDFEDFGLSTKEYYYHSDINKEMMWIYTPLTKEYYNHFTTCRIVVNLSDSSAKVLQSSNRTELVENYQQHKNPIYGFISKVTAWHSTSLPPFKRTFVAVIADEPYRIRVHIQNVDIMRVVGCVAGILVYVLARRIVRQTVFYYGSGTALGVFASLLIIVFIMAKYVPARSGALSLLLGGWSFSLYVLYSFCSNLSTVLITYQKWVAVYLVTAAFISFAICYRYGPPNDPRSINLNQWGLQLLSLCMIYAAGQVVEITVAIIGVLLLYSLIPNRIYLWLCNTWLFYNRGPRKLLTEDEYKEQGERETVEALRQLREYCRSPKCDSWKTVSKLKSPQRSGDRFIEFMAGNDSNAFDDDFESSEDDSDHEIVTEDESSDGDIAPNYYRGYANGDLHRSFNNGAANRRHTNLNKTVHEMRNDKYNNYSPRRPH